MGFAVSGGGRVANGEAKRVAGGERLWKGMVCRGVPRGLHRFAVKNTHNTKNFCWQEEINGIRILK